ncbi:PleD family two-component system response regulator [Terrihabitans soli]|uniref:diguanylate cyclase n=1 Tax=Terrihabitans soli TaxID=708113 RepID=A0A6S6QVS8_9HYPH|nr:PleD family two-component system response regulator [Terrihabitans soli]BCJ91130.1 PleD family two-component system response regulator [Terrihabitans soli]
MPARVLVVDDVLANVKLLEARLTAEYFEVVTAMSGQEALDVCARAQCDIVLLDIMMPGMDGFEVCRRLKADPATHHIPIVIITALDQPSDRVKGLEAGADDFLTKPVSDIALLARVRSLTRLKMMTDELRLRAVSGHQAGMAAVATDTILDNGLNGRILIVDDRAASTERIQTALRDTHTVDVESSPQEALFRAAETEYDLMIVSLGFTDFDALRLCSQARSLERTRNLPLLLIAEQEDTARVLRGLDLGVNDYLVRPIDRNELVARVMTQVRRKRYADRLRTNVQQSMELALTDSLTGLYNRRYMETHLETLIEKASQTERPLALVLIDIDHFKPINDTYGHDAGDEVLRQFSTRLQSSVRGIDLACRYGGEEFVVVMPDADLSVARAVGERLRRNIAAEQFPVSKGVKKIDVTISVGIAMRREGDAADTILKRADEALYQAKRDGRNRVVSDAA